MKGQAIVAGGFYHNNKDGVREVLAVQDAPSRVHYRILAAKAEREYDHTGGQMVSVIGRTSHCTLAAFAVWAKRQLTKLECDALLTELAAAKLKLSPGEQSFMQALLTEGPAGIRPGDCLSYAHTEGRAVGGLARKGLLVRRDSRTFAVTDLGGAWLRRAVGVPGDRSSP